MAEIENQLTALVETLNEHTKDDARQFEAMRHTFEVGMKDLKAGLDHLSKSIAEALQGSQDRAGLVERIRVLERAEQNRKWVTGILFVAVVGVVLNEIVRWIHVLNLK